MKKNPQNLATLALFSKKAFVWMTLDFYLFLVAKWQKLAPKKMLEHSLVDN